MVFSWYFLLAPIYQCYDLRELPPVPLLLIPEVPPGREDRDLLFENQYIVQLLKVDKTLPYLPSNGYIFMGMGIFRHFRTTA